MEGELPQLIAVYAIKQTNIICRNLVPYNPTIATCVE